MSLNGGYWFGVLSCCKDRYLGNLKELEMKGKIEITINIWKNV